MDYLRSKFFKQNQKQSTEAASASSNSLNTALPLEYFQVQFLIECLMRTVYTSHDHKALVEMCSEQVDHQSKDRRLLNEFERSYSADRAFWWYLQDSFLFKILNYSLESQDLRNLFLFRRVLRDVQSQIVQHRCKTPIHVYRSQLMPTELLDSWISSVGQCIIVNSFLSATIDPDTALAFLNRDRTIKPNYERVLLEIDADPRIPGSKPFVQTSSFDESMDKNEVIFLFGSIFLINNITCEETGIYRIELTLYTDSEHEFKQIFNEMKTKYGSGELSQLKFIEILKDLDRFDEAEEYLNNYRERISSNDAEQILCFVLLGSIAFARADFDTSFMWFNQALEFQTQHSLIIQNSTLAEIYEYLAKIYEHKNHRPQAISFFQKAISIYQRIVPVPQDKISQIQEHLK